MWRRESKLPLILHKFCYFFDLIFTGNDLDYRQNLSSSLQGYFSILISLAAARPSVFVVQDCAFYPTRSGFICVAEFWGYVSSDLVVSSFHGETERSTRNSLAFDRFWKWCSTLTGRLLFDSIPFPVNTVWTGNGWGEGRGLEQNRLSCSLFQPQGPLGNMSSPAKSWC